LVLSFSDRIRILGVPFFFFFLQGKPALSPKAIFSFTHSRDFFLSGPSPLLLAPAPAFYPPSSGKPSLPSWPNTQRMYALSDSPSQFQDSLPSPFSQIRAYLPYQTPLFGSYLTPSKTTLPCLDSNRLCPLVFFFLSPLCPRFHSPIHFGIIWLAFIGLPALCSPLQAGFTLFSPSPFRRRKPSLTLFSVVFRIITFSRRDRFRVF